MRMPTLRCALLCLSLLWAAQPGDISAANTIDGAASAAVAPAKKKAKPVFAGPAKSRHKHPARATRKTAPPQQRKVRPPVKVLTQAPAVPAAAQTEAASPQTPAGAAPASRHAALAALGVSLREGEDSAAILEILPGSQAAALGLAPRDRLVFLNAYPVRSPAESADAWLGWNPNLRPWAVVLRGLSTVPLQSQHPDEEPAFKRGPKDLSAQEAQLQAVRLGRVFQSAQAEFAQAPPMQVSIPTGQVLWIRFPAGIPETVATGDILEGEATMAVASDANLDFLCLPPRSSVSGKVLQAAASAGTRTLRIHFFKAALAGGHVIPISARLADAAGEQRMVKVSPGGTLVVGEPVVTAAQKKRKGPAVLLEPAVRLRLELAEPAAITEPPQFYAAGPGLWIRTKETEAGRQFELTHVIPGRSAEKAGLRVGDVLTAIAGRSTAKLEFGDALAALYGAPGSRLKVTVQKPAAKAETFELKRGVSYKDGVETPVPLPFDTARKT